MRRALLLALLWDLCEGSSTTPPLHVCITLDAGFNMLQENVVAADITSEQGLHGFDVDLRKLLMPKLGINYTVTVVGSCATRPACAQAFPLFGPQPQSPPRTVAQMENSMCVFVRVNVTSAGCGLMRKWQPRIGTGSCL